MQSSNTVAQINVRLDRGLKAAGDATLAEAGITPTELIRELWNKIARGTADVMQVREVLLGKASSEDNAQESVTVTGKTEALIYGRALFDEGLKELGIHAAQNEEDAPLLYSDEDAYARALVERMQERGTW